jgi:hypothetical protein
MGVHAFFGPACDRTKAKHKAKRLPRMHSYASSLVAKCGFAMAARKQMPFGAGPQRSASRPIARLQTFNDNLAHFEWADTHELLRHYWADSMGNGFLSISHHRL